MWGGGAAVLLTAALLGVSAVVEAQGNPEWSATLVVRPTPSPYLSDWSRDPGNAQLTVFYRGNASVDYRVEAVIVDRRRGELGRAVSPEQSVPFGPYSQLFTSTTLVDWQAFDYDSRARDVAMRTGLLPEGDYQLCTRLRVVPGGAQLVEACADFRVAYPDPPQLIAPAHHTGVLVPQPAFQWMPAQFAPGVTARYRLRIAHRLPSQAPQAALQSNVPQHEAEIEGVPFHLYPPDALPLEVGREYVWQVELLTPEGAPLGVGRRSEIYSFRYGVEGGGPTRVATEVLPDTLILVPGFAYLTGLREVALAEASMEYILNGRATLEVHGAFTMRTPVELAGLSLDREGLDAPRFRSGSLRGTLGPADIPAELRGPHTRLTDVRFTPSAGLTVGGELQLPGRPRVPLTGRARLRPTGLDGTLYAAATSGNALLHAGQDPARWRVTRAELTYPGGAVRFAGALELFGQEPGCGDVAGEAVGLGTIELRFLCAATRPLALVTGATYPQLALGGVDGALSVDLASGTSTPDLLVHGAIRLDGGVGCSALAVLHVGADGVRADRLEPACAEGARTVRRGWLALDLGALRVERFGYVAGRGFDFALQANVTPRLPALPGLALPAFVDVAIGPDGWRFPAAERPGTAQDVPLAGFALAVRRVGAPARTIGWTAWEAPDAAAFGFAVDASLALPGLGAMAPACLAGAPLALSATAVERGVLRATLEARDFAEGACVLPHGDAGFALTGLAGTAVVGLGGPAATLDSMPEASGALRLPADLRCDAGEAIPLGQRTVRFAPTGRVVGRASGLAPPCPVELAALSVVLRDAELDLGDDPLGTPVAIVRSAADARFTLGATPASGSGTIGIDLLARRMLSGRLEFAGPFRLDIPRDRPTLSFDVARATLDTLGLLIDGRQSLVLPGDTRIAATFIGLRLDPLAMRVLAGEVRFDAAFALEATLADALPAWRAVARETALPEGAALRVDLAEPPILDRAGLRWAGEGTGALAYDGRQFPALTSVVTPDLAFTLDRFGVQEGRLDLRLRDVTVASVDRDGFRPNLAVVGGGALPARLPLPNASVAYLQVRSETDSSLLVEAEPTTEGGLRVRTRPGAPVALVLPALQGARAVPPRIDVEFDLTFDGLLEGLLDGRLAASVVDAAAAGLDLTAVGVPFIVDSVSVAVAGRTPQLALAGRLPLFGDARGGRAAARLTLDAGGTLGGDMAFVVAERIGLVPGSERIALAVDSVRGHFDVHLPTAQVRFAIDLIGGLELETSTTGRTRAAARVEVSDAGVRVSDLTLPTGAQLRRLELGDFALGLDRLAVPRLEYIGGQWDFEVALDVALEFPGLGDLRLPTLRQVLLTPRGLALPEYVVPEFPENAAVVDLGGFRARPLAFRMAPLTFDWVRGLAPTDWGFRFDLELGFDGLPAALPPELRGVRVSVLDAGYANGRFTGRIETRDLAVAVPLPLGAGAGIDLTRIGGALGAGGGAAAVEVTVAGRFRLPESMRCAAQGDPTLAMPGAEFSLSGAGRVRGTVTGLVPSCPLTIGPLAARVTRSSLTFAVDGEGAQQALFAFDGAVRLPPPPGSADSVVAQGSLTVDLVAGRITDGAIEVTQRFGVGFPAAAPVLTFGVERARVDTAGLTLTGGGELVLAEGARIGVRFDDLALGLPDFRVRGGGASFTAAFAIGASMAAGGGLTWQALPASAPPLAADGFRLVLPSNVGFDARGLRIDGTATASARVGERSLDALSVEFINQFAFGIEPFGVRQGRANLRLDTRTVAYVDSTGFWPGDVFAVVPLPARLGLPDTTVAFLQLREGDEVLVETEAGPSGLSLRTRPGRAIRLEIPALRQGSDPAPAVQVEFAVTVDPRTFAFVDGRVSATTPAGASSLLPLRALGIPLDITDLAYEPSGGGPYAIRLGARLVLPASMGDVTVRFDSLRIGPSGFSGSAEVGHFSETYDATARPVVSGALGADLTLEVLGVRAEFPAGETPRVRLAGALKSPLFAAPTSGGDPPAVEPIFLTASVGGAAGFEATVDLAALERRELPLGVATFTPGGVGGAPALALRANEDEFTVRLSGTFRIPSLARDFGVTVRELSVGTRGIEIPDVRIATPAEGQQFELFGQRFVLRDSIGGGADFPALGFRYSDRLLTATMTGAVTLFPGASWENTSRFWGLSVTSAGDVSIAGAQLLSRSVAIIGPDVFQLDSVNIESNTLRIATSVRLPQPLAQDRQRATIAISPDGSVSGSARIVALSDDAPCCTGNQFINFGVAKVRLRHLSLTLDMANPQAGGIEAVIDAYVGTNEAQRPNNHIRVGDVAGGVVQPGLRVGFDGSVRFQNYALAREFEFDFQVLKLRLSQVAAPTTQGQFGVVMSGGLSLNIAAVTGSIAFERFAITERGLDFPSDGIREASLSIQNILTVRLADLVFIDRDTTLRMANPSGSAQDDSVTVNVSTLISFGGSLSMGNDADPLFAGGVDRFLFYRETGAGITLIIRNAHLSLRNIVDMQADFLFRESASGFEMSLGAQARLKVTPEVGVRMYGMVSHNITPGDGLRLGMFLAVTTRIDLLPSIALTEMGAGFFYRPRASDLARVYQLAAVNDSVIARLERGPAGGAASDFAVMLYAQVSVVAQSVVEGRVLVAVTSNYFLLYGQATLLNQGAERLSGGFYLQIGLRHAFAQGMFWVNINYAPLITGTAQLEFFVYGANAWGIKGDVNLRLLQFMTAQAQFYVGPPGFLFSLAVTRSFDVWIVSIKAGFSGTIWYRASLRELGGYAEVFVSAELLGGLVSADARLRGAFLAAPTWMLYASASLRVRAVFVSWSGSIWVKARSSGFSSGFGSDPTMNQMIARAAAVQGEMEAAKRQAEAAIADARSTPPEVQRYGNAELAPAFRRLTELQGVERRQVSSMVAQWEHNVQWGDAPLHAWVRWYADRILYPHFAPPLELPPPAGLDSTILAMEREAEPLVGRLRDLRGEVTELHLGSADSLPESPVRAASFADPVTATGVDEFGRETRSMTSGPGFDLNEEAARELLERARESHDEAEAGLREIAARIRAIETLLQRSGAVLSAADEGSMARFGERFSAVRSEAQLYLARQTNGFYMHRGYLRHMGDSLAGAEPGVRALVAAKTAAAGGDTQRLRRLGTMRARALDVLMGTDTIETRFVSDADMPGASLAWFREQVNEFGMALWFRIGAAGLPQYIAGLDSVETMQRRAGGERLTAVDDSYGAFSASYALLAEAHGNLTGALADTYDRYLFRAAGAPETVGAEDTVAMRGRRTALDRLLAPPSVTWTYVMRMNRGHYSEQELRYLAYHPDGIMAYEYSDERADGLPMMSPTTGSPGAAVPPDRYFLAGRATTIRTYAVQPDAEATRQARILSVGARGGAGFRGSRGTTYEAVFEVPRIRGYGTDLSWVVPGSYQQIFAGYQASTPSAPAIGVPGVAARPSGPQGAPVLWVPRPSPVEVTWSAQDLQSGIRGYWVGIGRRPDTADVRPMTDLRGRTSLVLDDVPILPDQPLYVFVQAVNGQGVRGPVAVSPAIQLDPSPPRWTAGATVRVQPLPAHLVGSTHIYVSNVPACAVRPPPLPGIDGGGATVVGTVPDWGGILTPAGGTSAMARDSARVPMLSFAWGVARDDESGAVERYLYRIDTLPAERYEGSGWVSVGGSVTTATASGLPLDYVRRFHISVVAVNASGLASDPIVSGPMQVPDAWRPSTPVFCAAVRPTGDILVRIDTLSTDAETGVTGYQYAIMAGSQYLRNFPTFPTVDFTAEDVRNGVLVLRPGMELPVGAELRVQVRAVTPRGFTSSWLSSGPTRLDRTPPPAPTVGVRLSPILGTNRHLMLQFTATQDPESRTALLQYAIGRTEGGTEALGWTDLPAIMPNQGFWSVDRVLPRSSSREWHISVRAVNGAGLASPVVRLRVEDR